MLHLNWTITHDCLKIGGLGHKLKSTERWIRKWQRGIYAWADNTVEGHQLWPIEFSEGKLTIKIIKNAGKRKKTQILTGTLRKKIK